MGLLSPKLYQFLVSCFASVGSFTYGYDLGIIAQVVASDHFIVYFNEPDSTKTGLVVSLFTAGAFVGAFFAGFMSSSLGRRGTIAAATVVFIFGCALQCGARNMSMLIGGRFIGGMGVGILTMIIPLYQAELAHPSIRGRVTALQQFFLGIGALCASWIGYGCYLGFRSDNQWRVPLGIQIIPAGILGGLIFFFPESPRWLLDKDRHEDGLKTLARLYANGDVDSALVRVEYDEIVSAINEERENGLHSWRELFFVKSNFRRLFICISLQASIQMTGVSAIQYYSPTIFAQIGLSTGRTLLFQAINSIIALIGQGFCIALVDITGRRWPLICGNLGNCMTFIAGAILLAKFPPGGDNPRSAQIGFIATTWIYNFFFSSMCGPLSWIIPAEVFNTKTRSWGVAISTMTCYAFNTMIGQVTDKAMTEIGYKYYFLFIICNFTNAIFFWALLPETGGTPLESMNKLWETAPWFVPTMHRENYLAKLEAEVHEQEAKGEKSSHVELALDEKALA
ncbi:general substrate transporter [Myxozyma melibiosi]|uniref:General substrate transporter n=1 Tax=Myxozyma melibiosi TaxID=54550 RepID=A0ABR1EZJ8_9ASCO